MKTGFYNTETLSKAQQKKFMKEAIFLSYKVLVESKYVREPHRTEEPDITIDEALKLCDQLKAVNRTIQFGDLEPYGECSLITTSFRHPKYTYDENYPNMGWLLLYCYMSIENLEKLTQKYNLIMK